jgi:hypothetical protein
LWSEVPEQGGAVTSSRLIRWCGIAGVFGGVLWEAWGGALLLVPGHLYRVWGFVALIVPLLFSVALGGLYTTLTGRWKVIGGTGLVLAVAGLFVALCGSVWAKVLPVADVTPVCVYFARRGLPQYMLGWVSYLSTASVVVGLAVLRAKALGRWSVVPLVVGLIGGVFYVTDFGSTVGLLLANIVFGLLFGLSWVLLGYVLWSCRGMPARHPAHLR